MDERCLKWFYDVKIAIDEIDSYFTDKEKNFFEYQKNLMLKRATERNLEIIGEAINRIKQRDESLLQNITEASSIIGLRNQVIHAYDNISDENIWSILINHLPTLRQEINSIIVEND